jgi:predicted Zn-dependent protease
MSGSSLRGIVWTAVTILGVATFVAANARSRRLASMASGESLENFEVADLQGAERTIRESLRRNPSNPRLQELLAQYLFAEGKLREAAAALRKAAVLSPSDPSLWLDLAQNSFITRDYRQAAADAKACLKIAPYCLQALIVRSLSLEKFGDKTGALRAWKQLAELDPSNVVAARALKRLAGTGDREPIPPRRITSITLKWQ